MEISAPAPSQLDHPWRTATLVAGGVAVLELALLLIIGIALLSKPLSAQAKQAAVARETGIAKVSPRPEPKSTTLARRATWVLVLNGNGVAGAAAAAASRIHARGYPVRGTGNTAQGYGQSVVMYRPGRLPEAKRLSADLGIALVGPLDGITPRQLHGAQLVVVLGT
ncbi:MAG TPA: LytR C-terminal domain-containing protein [Gaiellaceae bacterium]|nr:LytR C-terminal domain-containing protein [Gaiellaceae bacterium]